MFCDTHCHLSHIEERGERLDVLFVDLNSEGFRFVLDISTKPGDLSRRLALAQSAASEAAHADSGFIPDSCGLPSWLHFSAGLWPDAQVIADRTDTIRLLSSDIQTMLELAKKRGGLAALGECGLDRFWNGPAAAARLESSAPHDDGPGTVDIAGEEELFAMQLELALQNHLPIIIHSREAFEPTLNIIRNSRLERGVIHCFSYGITEARAFLDAGFYISFPGNITWAKKETDRDRITSLLRYVPQDRLLLETDAPYLAPAPHRGKTNTPLFIPYIYEQAAAMTGMDTRTLAELVFVNSKKLFSITEGQC